MPESDSEPPMCSRLIRTRITPTQGCSRPDCQPWTADRFLVRGWYVRFGPTGQAPRRLTYRSHYDAWKKGRGRVAGRLAGIDVSTPTCHRHTSPQGAETMTIREGSQSLVLPSAQHRNRPPSRPLHSPVPVLQTDKRGCVPVCLLSATYGQPQTTDQQVSSPFPELLPLPAQPKPSLVRGPSVARWSVCWPLIQHSIGSRLGWFRARHDHGERRRKDVELELLLPARGQFEALRYHQKIFAPPTSTHRDGHCFTSRPWEPRATRPAGHGDSRARRGKRRIFG